MNYRELIAALIPLHGAREARAIVRLVMEERYGLSQTDLLLGKDTQISATDRKDFEKIAVQLLDGVPVQYVLGFADFCGHRFRVTPEVLIPRPETEELVRWAVTLYKARQTPSAILDLCTGSGCIAISLALAFPEAFVDAVDISPSALAVATSNAHDLGAENIHFIEKDIESIETDSSSLPTSPYQLIISNPPYIRECEAADMSATVLDHEPHQALFVPDGDPLLFYRAIARIALAALAPGGLLMVELNAALADSTYRLFEDAGFIDIQVRHDQFGRPRMLKAKWQGKCI